MTPTTPNERKPSFRFKETTVFNYRTNLPYTLKRIVDITASSDFLASVVNVCNEPHIYNWLFFDRLKGKPYPPQDATYFVEWGSQGWQNNTHFVFVATDQEGRAAAAADIKSTDVDGAEIGYWCSAAHSGLMTNVVQIMLNEGHRAGFNRFFARIKKDNHASKAVVLRLGFVHSVDEQDSTFDHFWLSMGN